jgi:hypothetical protein
MHAVLGWLKSFKNSHGIFQRALEWVCPKKWSLKNERHFIKLNHLKFYNGTLNVCQKVVVKY